MPQIYNRASDKRKRQQLRTHAPVPEQRLWLHLRGRQVLGFKFRRQYGVGPYVLDFYCPQLRLGIEVDGDSHYQPSAWQYDQDRQRHIEALGIEMLRVTNRDVQENLDGVLTMIADRCRALERKRSLR